MKTTIIFFHKLLATEHRGLLRVCGWLRRRGFSLQHCSKFSASELSELS